MAMRLSDVDKLPESARREVMRQMGQSGTPIPKPAKRSQNKFGEKRGEDGRNKLERAYREHLGLREAAGEVANIREQVVVNLPIGRRYMRVDFVYLDKRIGEVVYDDTKGMCMPDWKVKADIWAAGFGPGRLRIVRHRGGAWVFDAEYLPKVDRRVLEALRGQLSKSDLEYLNGETEETA